MRLRRDKIVVALEHKVLMYNFADLRLEHSTETSSNPKGLVSLSAAPEHNVVACPGLHCGQVSLFCACSLLQYGCRHPLVLCHGFFTSLLVFAGDELHVGQYLYME